MEVKIVRFSRPLLIRVSRHNDDYFYQTIYGFWLPDKVDITDPYDEMRVEQYMGYLAGLHFWSSGLGPEDGFFTIHDCICVKESDSLRVQGIMERVSQEMYGDDITIRVKRENTSEYYS